MGYPSPIGSANLELYLDSRLGTSGFADGASVSPLPDQSGHSPARDAVNGGPPSPIMRRSGIHRSPSGQPGLQFNGLDAPNGSMLTSAQPSPFPAVTLGYTYLLIARLRNPTNSFAAGIIFEGTNKPGPQAIYRSAGGHQWGWRDDVGFVLGSGFSSVGGVYGAFAWRFPPPSGTGVGTVVDYSSGVAVTQASGVWTNTQAFATNGYDFGANVVDNVAADMDFFAYLWWSRFVPDAELALYRGYFGIIFG